MGWCPAEGACEDGRVWSDLRAERVAKELAAQVKANQAAADEAAAELATLTRTIGNVIEDGVPVVAGGWREVFLAGVSPRGGGSGPAG